jgi:Ca2+-transporting ATPase
VSPEQKLRIVEALQGRGDIVGMLGDGVNDAAALKKADIGVAMGIRGTDVAKETADVVLQDDRFETIGVAVEHGRVIYDNIRKFIFYLFSCNLSEVATLLVTGLAGMPLPLLPLQILWLNLVTDVFPALALAMEPPEPDVMGRPPRDPKSAILSPWFLSSVVTFSLLITSATLGVFIWALEFRQTELSHAVTLAFMTLALAQLFHVFNARSARPVVFGRRLFRNRWVWGALALTIGLQLGTVYDPLLSRVLRTHSLSLHDWLVVLAASLMPLVIGQMLKPISMGSSRKRAPLTVRA